MLLVSRDHSHRRNRSCTRSKWFLRDRYIAAYLLSQAGMIALMYESAILDMQLVIIQITVKEIAETNISLTDENLIVHKGSRSTLQMCMGVKPTKLMIYAKDVYGQAVGGIKKQLKRRGRKLLIVWLSVIHREWQKKTIRRTCGPVYKKYSAHIGMHESVYGKNLCKTKK